MSVQHSVSFVRGGDDSATCVKEATNRKCDERAKGHNEHIERAINIIEESMKKSTSPASRRQKLRNARGIISEYAMRYPESSCAKRLSDVVAAYEEMENSVAEALDPTEQPHEESYVPQLNHGKQKLPSAPSPRPKLPYRAPFVEGTFPNIIRRYWVEDRIEDGRVEILNRLRASGSLFLEENSSSSTCIEEEDPNTTPECWVEDRAEDAGVEIPHRLNASGTLPSAENLSTPISVGKGSWGRPLIEGTWSSAYWVVPPDFECME
ncbi:MAG: hypothetical protein Q9186_006533 [Xanthomendoza sp. 1 TL-2023]